MRRENSSSSASRRAGAEASIVPSARNISLESSAAQTGNTVFVSDYLYSDAFAFDDFTDHYREALALCDRALAKCCDQVIEVSYGFYHYWKGL